MYIFNIINKITVMAKKLLFIFLINPVVYLPSFKKEHFFHYFTSRFDIFQI